MVVEELVAKLGLEVDGGTFKVAEELMAVARHGMFAIGAAALAAAGGLAAAVAKTAEHADAIEKAAQRTGIGVEALQALQYAAERADVGAEGLQASLNFMAKRGVKDFEAELRRAADELSAMPDGGEKAARAMQLFGKQGAMLIPMLNKGSAGLDEMTQLARDAGIVLGEDMVESGAGLKDALEDLQAFVRGFAYMLAGPLLKPVRGWVEAAREWIKANREIIGQRVQATLELVGKALGLVFRLAEPVVDVLFRLVQAVAESKVALLGLGAIGLWLAAPFLAPVAAIGLFLMALEEVWGWVTGKRDTLLGRAFGPFADLMKVIDLDITPEDSNIVAIAKLTAQWLERAVVAGRELAAFLGRGKTTVDMAIADLGSPDRAVREKAVARLQEAGIATWQGRDIGSFGPLQGGVPNVQFGGAADGPPTVFPGLGSAGGGGTTTIGSITVQAPPGSTAQDVVDLVKDQIGAALRTEYVTALPAARGP